MKVWIILLSLLAAAAMWQWGPHRRQPVAQGWRSRRRQLTQSLLAGVVVYFAIMSVAAVYVMLVTA